MPVDGLPGVLSVAEFNAWRVRHGKPPLVNDALRTAYWQYRANVGHPVPGSTYSVTPKIAQTAVTPPPIPDTVAALQQQRDLLYQQYNPQRHSIAAGTAATLEGQGYADSGTAKITEQRATNPDGTPAGNDVRYLVFRGADGRLYRQAYVSVQNTGAQHGSLYTSGTADEHALNRQRLDTNRQSIITSGDQQQTSSLANEANAYTNLDNQWRSGMDAWRQSATSAVQTAEPPPSPATTTTVTAAKSTMARTPKVNPVKPVKPVKPVVRKSLYTTRP